MSPAPKPSHQSVSTRLLVMLDQLIPNGEIFASPIDLRLDKKNVPQPDLVWVMEGGNCKVGEKYLEGVPALVVEILSPGNIRRDRAQKFLLYEKFGINEYWLVDANERYLEIYVWVDGHYRQQGAYGVGETFNSLILGDKTVDVSQIFRMVK